MFTEDEFSVFDFAVGISAAVDLISPELNDHHNEVAYVSYCIAREMNLTDDEIKNTVLAAILHDIGAFTEEERLQVVYAQFDDSDYSHHNILGYKLLCNFEPYSEAATIIKYHHVHYDETKNDIPIGSYVVHLADRLCVLIDKKHEILEQVSGIMDSINKNRSMFHPDTVTALERVAEMEYFWIEVCSLSIANILPERVRFSKSIIDLTTLRSLAKVISQIIDFRSRFTATHSSGVAAVALELTKISGFSEKECALMEIAGYLHDLGKLAISNDILDKNGALNHEEFNEMRKHPYFTYTILSEIKGFEQVAMWAAYHHERLDGKGYPFHVIGENFTKLARIMAVADIVTAITEDRPYRLGMSSDKAMEVLAEMVDNGGIDKGTVELAKENFAHINEVRINAQQKAQQEYHDFNDLRDFHLFNDSALNSTTLT